MTYSSGWRLPLELSASGVRKLNQRYLRNYWSRASTPSVPFGNSSRWTLILFFGLYATLHTCCFLVVLLTEISLLIWAVGIPAWIIAQLMNWLATQTTFSCLAVPGHMNGLTREITKDWVNIKSALTLFALYFLWPWALIDIQTGKYDPFAGPANNTIAKSWYGQHFTKPLPLWTSYWSTVGPDDLTDWICGIEARNSTAFCINLHWNETRPGEEAFPDCVDEACRTIINPTASDSSFVSCFDL